MTRTTRVLAGATTIFALAAGPAFAGEVRGQNPHTNPTPKTLKDVQGHSICAYSGLNDGFYGIDPDYPDGFEPGATRAQSFGQIVRYAGPLGGIPGTACNPTAPPPPPEG